MKATRQPSGERPQDSKGSGNRKMPWGPRVSSTSLLMMMRITSAKPMVVMAR